MSLSWTVKLSYSVGHVFNDMGASMWFFYLLLYLVYVLEVNPAAAGFLIFLGQIVQGLFTPLVGLVVDRSVQLFNQINTKYNARKAWHLTGTVLVAVCLPLIFCWCPNCFLASEWALVFYLSSLVVFYQLGWAIVQVSHLSLIPELSLDEAERDQLNTMRYSFDVGCDLILFVVMWVMFAGADNGEGVSQTDAYKFTYVIITIIVVGILSSSIFQIGTKVPGNTIIPSETSKKLSWTFWVKDLNFQKVASLHMFSRLFSTICHVYIPVYLQGLGAPEYTFASVPLTLNISGLVTSTVLIGFLTRCLGKKYLFILGVLIGFSGQILLLALSKENIIYFGMYLFGMLAGPAISIMLVTSLSLTADLISTYTIHSAFVYGYMSSVEKIFTGFVIWIIQVAAELTSADYSKYYSLIIIVVPSCSLAFGLLTVFFMSHKPELKLKEETAESSSLLSSTKSPKFIPEEILFIEANYSALG